MGVSHSRCVPWAAQDGRLDDLVFHLSCVEDLKAALRAPCTETNPKRNTPLHMAAIGGHSQCIRVLYDAGGEGRRPMYSGTGRQVY